MNLKIIRSMQRMGQIYRRCWKTKECAGFEQFFKRTEPAYRIKRKWTVFTCVWKQIRGTTIWNVTALNT